MKKRIRITIKIVNKNENFFNNDILLLLYLHYLKINNILFFNILKTILYLFFKTFRELNRVVLI